MKHRIIVTLAALLTAAALAGCGSDREMERFKQEMDSFCIAISELDTSINNVDPEDENATALVLKYLDQLDAVFQDFADMDFPEEFDELERLADKAGEYMSIAVKSYHAAYADGKYDPEIAAYAKENSFRAFKHVQTIITLLHGEDLPDTP